MREVPASKGFVAIVDDEDFARISAYRWHAKLHGYGRGPKEHYRPCSRENGKSIYLYHLVLPPRAGFVIDHINGDPWDNRRCNLRYATPGQNVRNQRRAKKPKWGFKGVCKKRLRFFAHIGVNGREIWTRGYATPVDAARAYDELALKHHGDFASLNFPREAA